VLPLEEIALPAVPDERMAPEVAAPSYITSYSRKPG
jgi:hypothetical protein